MRTILSVTVAALLSVAAFTRAGSAADAQGPKTEKDALAAFDVVARVLLSPRCRNCHPAGDRPLQFDDGRPHAQEVGRRASKLGLDCGACHQHAALAAPLDGPHMPPGAVNWGLAPAKQIFEGRTPAQLCRQLKDPAQAGDRDLAEILEHLENDDLVAWGWNPGEGRTPVPVPRAELVAAFRTWMDGGAVCPD